MKAHTFDIRFARSTGLAAFLQAPTNTFRWKGAGRLSIDPEGISIALKRGVLALFPHTQRVSAADLKGVLREGEALRVEFSTDKDSRAVVLFWVRDQETAEEIVRLLPTTRTVELNHDAAGIAQARVGIDWRALTLFAAALVAIAGSAWMLKRSDAPVPVVQADSEQSIPETSVYPEPLVEATADEPAKLDDAAAAARAAVPQDATSVDLPAELASPDPYAPAAQAAGDTPELAPAEPMNSPTAEDPLAYEAKVRIAGMTDVQAIRQLVEDTRQGVGGSSSLDARWWAISVRLYNYRAGSNSRDLELAVSRAWRDYIYLRDIGHPGAEFALEFAERLTARAGYSR
ncbi:MAG TPA: hypothetical protein VFO82_14975 [Steroidobacteraceae bacterium]|nr:hypothetical protein [Steroidobacteraceae bacterium]